MLRVCAESSHLLEENKMELFDSSILALSIIQGRDGGGSGFGGLPVCATDSSAAAGRAEVAGTTGRHCDAMPVLPPPTAPHHPLSARCHRSSAPASVFTSLCNRR